MTLFLKISRKSSGDGVMKRRISQYSKSKGGFQDGPSAASDKELHVFTDASEFAYGAAAYIKVTNETGIHVSLLMGKSRVAPLKCISIPRLELTAAAVGAKLSRFIMDELDVDDITVHYWTDSMTVLRYLRNVSTRFQDLRCTSGAANTGSH